MFVGFNVNSMRWACFIKTIEEAHDFVYSEECDDRTEDFINSIIDNADGRILEAIQTKRAEHEHEV